MSYIAQETSVRDGQRVFLYTFFVDGEILRYTNAENDVLVDSFNYSSETVTFQEPARTFDEDADRVEIELPSTNQVASNFIDVVPATGIQVEIASYHRTDASVEVLTFFEGKVRACTFGGDGMAKLTARSEIADFNQQIPRDTFQGPCNNNLGDALCKVDLDALEVSLSVSTIISNVYTITGLSAASGIDPDYFVGGVITSPNGEDARTIMQVTGDEARVLIPFSTSQVSIGTLVTVTPGCNHQIDGDCENKYNNAINFFGFPFVPDRNPFQEGLI